MKQGGQVYRSSHTVRDRDDHCLTQALSSQSFYAEVSGMLADCENKFSKRSNEGEALRSAEDCFKRKSFQNASEANNELPSHPLKKPRIVDRLSVNKVRSFCLSNEYNCVGTNAHDFPEIALLVFETCTFPPQPSVYSEVLGEFQQPQQSHPKNQFSCMFPFLCIPKTISCTIKNKFAGI